MCLVSARLDEWHRELPQNQTRFCAVLLVVQARQSKEEGVAGLQEESWSWKAPLLRRRSQKTPLGLVAEQQMPAQIEGSKAHALRAL